MPNVPPVELRDAGGTPALITGIAPVSDSGQVALAVRVISFLGTVAVSGPLTDAQLRASAVPVVGAINHDGALDSKLLVVGGTARDTAPLAASADGNASRAWFDRVGRQQVIEPTEQGTDQYTATGNGATIDCRTRPHPLRSFACQVKGVGAAATTWDVRLEGSLNGTDFVQLVQHTNATGDGAIVWSINTPVFHFRSRCAGLVLGAATKLVVIVLGVA